MQLVHDESTRLGVDNIEHCNSLQASLRNDRCCCWQWRWRCVSSVDSWLLYKSRKDWRLWWNRAKLQRFLSALVICTSV